MIRRSAILLLALCVACETLTGVDGGNYASPDGAFSMAVPKLGPGLAIENSGAPAAAGPTPVPRRGYVSFHDDFGHIRSVTYEELPETMRAVYADGTRCHEAFSAFLRETFLPQLAQRVNGSRVTHESALVLADGTRALFAVVEMPGGSPMVVTSEEYPNGRRLDSTRAHLFLLHGSLFVTLSSADDLAIQGQGAARPTPTAEDLERWKNLLAQLYASMRFG